ncbi:hypothetical protein [Streptacidiphilus carbonis]|uniref:hypothetical protein n=1 Tax=Streptacidiphilus carbonis TaxID=105422 RepID=UPI0005AA1352|nr:hypothetical protein [Streptacidiphilus carbonis]
MTTLTAVDRVAQLRKQYAIQGEPLDALSDLDVLNRYAVDCERERIAINDRYMSVLVEQRKHGDAVRTAERIDLARRADAYARAAVDRWITDLTRILRAVEVLPDCPKPERVALVKQIATDTRHMISLRSGARSDSGFDRIAEADRLALHNVRSVVGVLGAQDGLPVGEVIRMLKAALDPAQNIRDLFMVADTGTPKAELRPQPPLFLGDDWSDRVSFYAYEPDAGTRGRVVAYAIGDQWHLDVQTSTGGLVAYGIAAEQDVAAMAPLLVGRAQAWAKEPGYAWRRFQDATKGMATDNPAGAAE